LAGWFDAPLVSLAPVGAATEEREPLLKLQMRDGRASRYVTFPSAAGVEAAVAFEVVRIAPNQPEQGAIRLQVTDAMPQDLDPGSTLELRPLGDRTRVTSDGPTGRRRTWFAREVTVGQRYGVHVVERDALPVADLDRTLAITYHPQGLVQHRV
jgi:hypothetical protein